MEKRPRALLLKFPGTNCDAETARALRSVGFDAEIAPVSTVSRASLDGVRLVVLSGGFSYGDYVMSGRIASLVTQLRIDGALSEFRDAGGYLLGICNGFQILTQLGLLPAGSLVHNTSGRFQCRWVTLENRSPDSPFLRRMPARFEFPIAHAEGRFVTTDPATAETYVAEGLAALTYADDVNGSFARIAGMQDETGRVFGLMPHPERFMGPRDHYDPDWSGAEQGSGYYFFQSLFEAITQEQPESIHA
jgi:phosphoribosylformylglycinamidine synthase I